MNGQELRIGNLVNYEQTTHVIASIDKGYASSYWNKDSEKELYRHSLIYISPIPLTEEILFKCKFNFKKLGFPDLAVSHGMFSKEIHFVTGNYHLKIEFVHQLQNLYFLFTGKELEIEEL